MPELPEVETTCRGIAPHLVGQTIQAVHIYQPQLRWKISDNFTARLMDQQIYSITRRAKYIIIQLAQGYCLLHLGMSGSVRIVPLTEMLRKHDHVSLQFSATHCLRYHDPRRFGCWLWGEGEPIQHPLLKCLGVEPLSAALTATYLAECARKRRIAVKAFIMSQAVVVGVGNIYASEALFLAGIDPRRPANQISIAEYATLILHIQAVLNAAIELGGTTLRDFTNSEGQAGYFQQTLRVYGRTGKPCVHCGTPIMQQVIAQRSSFFCHTCQQ
jgi:formamidopyrimidine-DNA glycosylase